MVGIGDGGAGDGEGGRMVKAGHRFLSLRKDLLKKERQRVAQLRDSTGISEGARRAGAAARQLGR